MANINWMFKNKIETVTSITESTGTSNPNFGTANIKDFDLHSSFRSDTNIGTTTLLLNFGSAVFIDTAIAIHNLPTTGGTMILRGGTDVSPTSVSVTLPLIVKGTAVIFGNSNGYQYWELSMAGTAAGGYHELFELHLTKRKTLNENPTYPLSIRDDDDVSIGETEKGQKYSYFNSSRRSWGLNYEAVPQATYLELVNMKRTVSGGFKPLFFSLDPTGAPEETYFVRMDGQSFTYNELITQTWNVSFSIVQEI